MQIDPIKQKIQSLVPEVMELKFGCEVYRGADGVHEYFVGEWSDKIWLVREWRNPKDGTFAPFEIPRELSKKWQILGSPITLAVVLKALSKREGDESGRIWIDEMGRIMHGQWITTVQWNLAADNYDDQTQKTKDFIGSLLLDK